MSDFLNSNQLYPLKFTPIYQARIWGGTQMTEVLHREVPASEDPIGESWEIVDREGENSHSTPSTTTESLPQTATVHEEPEQEPVFEVAEVMPVFPGGTQALLNTIAQKLKYPPKAIDDQIEGRVVLQFVVDKQGKVTDIQVLQGITPELNQAAIDVVRALPDWNPGMQDGEPVNVKYTLPIVFKLK